MGMLLSYHDGYRPENEAEPAPRKRTRKSKTQEPTPAPAVEDTPEGDTPDE